MTDKTCTSTQTKSRRTMACTGSSSTSEAERRATVFKYEDGDFNNGHYLELGNIVELWAEYEEDEE